MVMDANALSHLTHIQVGLLVSLACPSVCFSASVSLPVCLSVSVHLFISFCLSAVSQKIHPAIC